MAKVRWGRIAAVILVILVMARWRDIKDMIGQMHLRVFWDDFCATATAIPPLGKYALVLGIMALAYLTILRLILYRRKGPQ